MWYYLSFVFILSISTCEETFKNVTSVEDSNFKNKSSERNNSFDFQRITQPSAQSQQIERSVTSPTTNSSTEKGKSEFRPSPHLETYYEFNKIPVPPALPEAKHFSAYDNFGKFPIQWPDSVTTEPTWATRVKFPTTSVPTSKERPYPFYNSDKTSTGKSYSVPMNSDSFMYQKPLDTIPTIEDWNKFLNYEKKKQVIQKNQFDFSAPVERPNYSNSQKTSFEKNQFDFSAPVERPNYSNSQKSGFEFGAVEKPQSQGLQGYPWKKIIKFLTAAIPIGLLISALTPTVITVQSVNGTQSRSRAVDSKNNKLISSLNYFNSMGCDDRILCELILSAGSTENGEKHVENLLNTFTQEGKAVEKADEMRRILEAVRNNDCRPIICKDMKEKT